MNAFVTALAVLNLTALLIHLTFMLVIRAWMKSVNEFMALQDEINRITLQRLHGEITDVDRRNLLHYFAEGKWPN